MLASLMSPGIWVEFLRINVYPKTCTERLRDWEWFKLFFLHLLLKKNRRMLSLIFDFHWSHHCWMLAYSFVEIMIPHKWIMVRYNWRTFVTIGYLSLIERGWDQVLVSVMVMLMMISLIWTLTKSWRGVGGRV